MTRSTHDISSGMETLTAALILAGLHDPDSQDTVENPNAPQAVAGRQTCRVLIIEDNVDAATSLGDYLELMGYQVAVTFSGPEGVEAAEQFAPDVVLCDVGLPGMDGWEVARVLRRNAARAGAHLVAITGYGTDEDRRRSKEAGFEAHLTKPLDLNALDALLERFA